MKTLLTNFHIVDEATNENAASVLVENGLISAVIRENDRTAFDSARDCATRVINGYGLTLMPAFVDLHAHFRDPGFPEKETLESASLAAVAGGYTTLVCMANTKPVIDTLDTARALKERTDTLALIDLYPAMALTADMAGKELSSITQLYTGKEVTPVRLLSEDGKDVADDALFIAAFNEAARLGIPVSCHCDAGGVEAEQAKEAGQPREVWSRIEENVATKRALALGGRTGAHVHIAHVSTKEALDMARTAKCASYGGVRGHSTDASGRVTCEATPHHLCLTETDAAALGAESFGRVNPPLRTEDDRQALIAGITDGTIDAIATDHAPHALAHKAGGAPGFTGLETSFAACFTELVKTGLVSLSRLSLLMSTAPARILGLRDRGRVAVGLRADLVVVDTGAMWTVDSALFKSRGKNSPFNGRSLSGRVVMTMRQGRIVFDW
jgi:dihydroorotase